MPAKRPENFPILELARIGLEGHKLDHDTYKHDAAAGRAARVKYQRTCELMGVELERLLDRKPPTLSGGEKQRVAIGRCITRDASLFLVDEPFANLDQALREKYRVNLKASCASSTSRRCM